MGGGPKGCTRVGKRGIKPLHMPIPLINHTTRVGIAPRLKLRLRDATGEVDVLLFGEEAILFFFGTRSVVEAPASPGQSQPAADRIVGRALTPALDGLLGATHQYVGVA